MERAKTDIDDIWKQLKKQQPNNERLKAFDKLWLGFSSDTCSKKAVTVQPGVSDELQFYLQQPVGKQYSRQAPPASGSSDQTSRIPGGTSVDKLVELLQSTESATRRATLKHIQAFYAQDSSSVSTRPLASLPATAAEAISTKLGKSLLKRFEDRVENCRELAVSTFKQLLKSGADAILPVLPYVMPVLEERLHIDEGNPTEPSEEIRLLLMQLLYVIQQQAGAAIAAYASEAWSIIAAALVDSYHEVALQGCRAAEQFAGTLGLRLGSLSKDLVAALLPSTTHNRHRVRIAAIAAIKVVMHQGAHEMILEMVAWRDPNMVPIKAFYGDDTKVNYCGKLATDHHVQVRLAFLHMVGDWMLTLRERNDHQARLLPYLLNGLCDEAPVVVDAACELLNKLGEQYEQEHEKDLEDLIRFGGAAGSQHEKQLLAAINKGLVMYASPDTCPASQPSTATGPAGATNTSAASSSAVFHIPGPFGSRPRLGSRTLVSNNFSGSLGALCTELSSWQSGPRLMSAKLLRVNLVLVEAAAERHLQVLLPALCTSIRNEDGGDVVADCAAVLGCHCDLGLILDLLCPRLSEGGEGDSRRQADVLLVLAAVLRGAGPLGSIEGHAEQLLALLHQSGIAASHDSSIKAAATAVMQKLLQPGFLQQLQLLRSDSAAHQQHLEQSTAAVVVTDRTASISSDDPRTSSTLEGFVHLLLQLASNEVPHLSAAAGVDSNSAAAEQAHRVEQLLQQLAEAVDCGSIDQLLGLCRKHVLNKVLQHLDIHSSSGVSVLCRLMMPSSCHWALTASNVATAFCRAPLPRRKPAAADYTGGWVMNDGRHCGGFAEGAEAYCLPEQLIALLQLIQTAEHSSSKHSHTPAALQLLQLAVDCCMAVWPTGGLNPLVLQQLLQHTVPTLLQSSHGLAAMTGLRALHHLINRGIKTAQSDKIAAVDSENSTQSIRQQQGQKQCGCGKDSPFAMELLSTAWHEGLCDSVCGLIQSDDAAVRLEACYLVEAVHTVLGASLVTCQPVQQSGQSTTAAAAVQPVAALIAALQDADEDVRVAASTMLQQVQTSTSGSL